MSGGKKRSGFQITSVTSDYSETPPSPAQLSQSTTSLQGSSSQPTTPLLLRKYSQDSSGQGAGSSHSSRFRVVRLAQGRGEPYRRGRWTCTDFLEREEASGLRRVMDSMRHAHSLESLETVGLIGLTGAGGGLLAHVRALRSGNHVHSQGTTHLLAQPMAMEREELAGLKPLLHHSGPPSPTQEGLNARYSDSTPLDRYSDSTPLDRYSDSTPLTTSPRPRNIPPPLRLDVDAAGRSLLRVSHSQPSSPGAPCHGDGVFQPSLTPIQTPSAFHLDRPMFEVPGDDSGSSNSLVAIDNKIEQAMDLVKTHLRLAVREEVEILREQIKELQERNAQLERENYILRALRDRD